MQVKIHKTLKPLRAYALEFPGAVEEFPWGHSAIKVNKKMFVIFGGYADDPILTVKLPQSGAEALELPCVEPTGYGMGRHGWVSITVLARDRPSDATLRGWVEESFRAIAPKRLVAQWEVQSGGSSGGGTAKKARKPSR